MGDFLFWVERASWCWLELIAPILYCRPQKVIRVLSDGLNGYRTTMEIMLSPSVEYVAAAAGIPYRNVGVSLSVSSLTRAYNVADTVRCLLDCHTLEPQCIPERYGETCRGVMSPPRKPRNAGSANQSASVAFHAERQSTPPLAPPAAPRDPGGLYAPPLAPAGLSLLSPSAGRLGPHRSLADLSFGGSDGMLSPAPDALPRSAGGM
ncbi:hypothetical protein KC363_g90 [Hortaea werneckii]|nr:hypothetical protein KC363_g90 [Hortaea werneckii]